MPWGRARGSAPAPNPHGLPFLPPAWSPPALPQSHDQKPLLGADCGALSPLFAGALSLGGLAVAFGAAAGAFGTAAVFFGVFAALGATSSGWALALAISSCALVSSATACT